MMKEVAYTRYRQIADFPRTIVSLLAIGGIGVSIFAFFRLTVAGVTFTEVGYYFILIALLLPPVFLYIPSSKKASPVTIPWYDILFAFIAFCIPFYFFLMSYEMSVKGWEIVAPAHVRILSLILIILVLEAVRRSIGLSLTIVCLFFLLFPLFTHLVPSPFKGVNFDFWRIVSFQVLGSEGFLGIPMNVVGTLLIGFMIFAVALQATGGGSFFLNIALALLGHVRGGPAKVSVFSSALFGSISGSVTANVLTTGCVTIPTMKKSGYPAHYAAAVEACASTGGVLMPPVMGAAAFIIAQILAIPYVMVALAAAVPSILYYLGLFLQADAYAAKAGLRGLPRETLPSVGQTLKQGWFYIFAFILLLWLLLFLGRVGQAPFYATAALFVLAAIRKETRPNLRRFIDFLESTARTLAELMAVMLAIGLIIGALSQTGIAHGFSSQVIELSGGNVYLLLLFGALTSFILGMGMSVTACYIFLAMLLAPALISAGLYPLSVHLYILYWAMISFITPPVAVGAYVAAGLAGSDPMKTGLQAMRMGVILYFIPVFFVLQPALLLYGSVPVIILSIVTAVIGVILISGGVEGYLVGIGNLSASPRVVLAMAGLLMAYPDWMTSAIGAVMGALTILASRLVRQRQMREAIANGIIVTRDKE